MRAIVETRFGPLQGKKAILEPGMRIVIGRTERADIVFPHDRQMSACHCEILWDGAQCTVRDLNSLSGTLLSGRRTSEGVVEHGGYVQAGHTFLMVYHEERTPPRLGADTAWTDAKRAALAELREVSPQYVVVDASRGPRVLEVIRESAETYRSLYEGPKGDALAEVAPHLVQLSPGSRLLTRLVQEGWGHRWGVYLSHPGSFKEARDHLRRFLRVENDETRRPMYFRFYDPAVLRTFLAACAPLERADFFREISGFWAEGNDAEVLAFRPTAQR